MLDIVSAPRTSIITCCFTNKVENTIKVLIKPTTILNLLSKSLSGTTKNIITNDNRQCTDGKQLTGISVLYVIYKIRVISESNESTTGLLTILGYVIKQINAMIREVEVILIKFLNLFTSFLYTIK